MSSRNTRCLGIACNAPNNDFRLGVSSEKLTQQIEQLELGPEELESRLAQGAQTRRRVRQYLPPYKYFCETSLPTIAGSSATSDAKTRTERIGLPGLGVKLYKLDEDVSEMLRLRGPVSRQTALVP
jgi:hypothetical protein